MSEISLIDVALIVAFVGFFKKQMGLVDNQALIAAFVVVLLYVFLPMLAEQFLPNAAVYVETFWKVVVLFLGATGFYDVATGIARSRNKSLEG